MQSLKQGLKAYMDANNKQLPSDVTQLQPYLDPPLDDSILQRWMVAPASTIRSLGMGGDVIITQKAPVDDVFDACFGIGPNGYGSTDFLSRETMDLMKPVWKAYSDAHTGADYPDDLSQLLPYATTPEQQAAVQKHMLHNSASK